MSAVASFDLGSTIGAFEVGVLISYVIFGITSLQAYVYYTRSEDDPVALRLMIAFVWLCELAHAICIGQVLYTFTIVNYGVLSSLRGRIPAGLALSIVLSGVITAVVQGFFAYRIFTLSTTKLFKLIAISVWVSEAVYLGFSFAATILSFPAPNIQVYLARRGWLLMASWIMNLINDTTITLSLVVLLLQNRMRGLDGTIALVDRLVKWTIGE
ncbi:hypothetical protein C8F01DRAFT_555286 [Mycena amicta]|nr:hypothetical protein C8F01DRAFT_555286 [Mycena amicta]